MRLLRYITFFEPAHGDETLRESEPKEIDAERPPTKEEGAEGARSAETERCEEEGSA
jgi:hypothetical protein